MEGEAIVDAGAWIAAIEALLRRPIDEVIGKPSALTARTACARLGLSPRDAMVVGDRIETDIVMGKAAGMATALVLSGVTSAQSLEASSVRPDLVLESLADLPDALGLEGAPGAA
jgi:ribonucleotide monophosphatase NagD (HAD superfamily)